MENSDLFEVCDFDPRRLNVPTVTLCRAANRYLTSIFDRLPEKVQNFIRKYPYASSLICSMGADCVIWIKNSDRGGCYLLNEIGNANTRDKGFPLREMIDSHLFDNEIGLLASLGFNYEIEYLRGQGKDVSDYSYKSIRDSIKLNEKLYSQNDEFSWMLDLDELAVKYFQTKENCEMLSDGGSRIPGLLNEKLLILTEILSRLEVEFDGRLITDMDRLPAVKVLGYSHFTTKVASFTSFTTRSLMND